jgi:hypothetical protein
MLGSGDRSSSKRRIRAMNASEPRRIPSKAPANGDGGGFSMPERTNRVYARRARLEDVPNSFNTRSYVTHGIVRFARWYPPIA